MAFLVTVLAAGGCHSRIALSASNSRLQAPAPPRAASTQAVTTFAELPKVLTEGPGLGVALPERRIGDRAPVPPAVLTGAVADGAAPIRGPFDRTVLREAARVAVEPARASPGLVAPRRGTSAPTDWSRVRDLEGETIVLTLHGAPPAPRQVVRGTVNDAGLTVLNLNDPAIPSAVVEVLADAAWSHPEYFAAAQPGTSVRVNRHVRLTAGRVFLDDQEVLDLALVIERVARSRVAEIRLVHRAAIRGLGWGALAGGVMGLAKVMGACGTHWNQETASCPNLTGAWLIFGPLLGLGVGSAVGAGYTISTVVYRAP